MALSTAQINAIGAAHEVQISTYRAEGSRRNSIPIWTVRIGEDIYIRSAFGPDAVWYRNAITDNRLHIDTGSVAIDVAVQPTSDNAVNALVDAAYRAKYPSGGSATTTMVTAPATGTTIKLLAAEKNR